jgi:hypothetical protein
MTDDELASEISRPVDCQRTTPDEELVSGRLGQLEDDVLPPSQNRHDPSGGLPDSHIDDAIPPADVLRGDTDRPSPIQPGAGPKGDECLPGPEPGW